jgi:hypothetical protein
MTLIYYSGNLSQNQQQILLERTRKVVNDEILILPKDFDVILNSSVEQLQAAKNTIDAAIKLKLNS